MDFVGDCPEIEKAPGEEDCVEMGGMIGMGCFPSARFSNFLRFPLNSLLWCNCNASFGVLCHLEDNVTEV